MLAAVTSDPDGPVVATFDDDGTPLHSMSGLAAVRELESERRPRWIFDAAADTYPVLLAAGVRVRRCHDVALTERILLGRAGRFGEPCRAAAVLARAVGAPVPDDPALAEPVPANRQPDQPGLFDRERPARRASVTATGLVTAYLDQ